jgi:hypothetical protein
MSVTVCVILMPGAVAANRRRDGAIIGFGYSGSAALGSPELSRADKRPAGKGRNR